MIFWGFHRVHLDHVDNYNGNDRRAMIQSGTNVILFKTPLVVDTRTSTLVQSTLHAIYRTETKTEADICSKIHTN